MPTLYMLSRAVLDFVEVVVSRPYNITPAGLNPRVAELVRAWEGKQTSGSSSMRTSTGLQTGSQTSLPQQVVTRGLSQLPRAWPYTRAGVARREGETARFTVTKALEGGVGEFVVEEGVVWCVLLPFFFFFFLVALPGSLSLSPLFLLPLFFFICMFVWRDVC